MVSEGFCQNSTMMRIGRINIGKSIIYWLPWLFNLTSATDISLRATSKTRYLNTPDLIEVVEPGNNIQIVRVSQTFVGSSENGCDPNDSENNALIMFATILDPDTLEEACGFLARNATPCFTETLVIGCDPATNSATINLYIRDETFDANQIISNPMIEECRAGNATFAARAIQITETFPCTGQGRVDGNLSNTCSETEDKCADGTFCTNTSEYGHFCKEFAPVGAPCVAEALPRNESICNPSESFCFQKEACFIPDALGVCVAFSGECVTDADCNDPATHYCREASGKCAPRLVINDCCGVAGQNSCALGLICREPLARESDFGQDFVCLPGDDNLDDMFGGGPDGLVDAPLESCTQPCGENEACFFSEKDSRFACRPYLKPGEPCGKYGIQDTRPVCRPGEAYCHARDACYNAESTGICVAYRADSECQSSDDCVGVDEWCDPQDNRCKETYKEDECCIFGEGCGVGLTCQLKSLENDIIEFRRSCRPICSDSFDCDEGEFCTSILGGSQTNYCKAYAPEGAACEYAVAMDNLLELCSPGTHYCDRTSTYCPFEDKVGSGTCKPIGNGCETSADCTDDSIEYCDLLLGHCKTKVDMGFCCYGKAGDECVTGSECTIVPADPTFVGDLSTLLSSSVYNSCQPIQTEVTN